MDYRYWSVRMTVCKDLVNRDIEDVRKLQDCVRIQTIIVYELSLLLPSILVLNIK